MALRPRRVTIDGMETALRAYSSQPYPPAVKARALALCLELGSIKDAAIALSEELAAGGLQGPTRTGVNNWVLEADPAFYAELQSRKREMLVGRRADVELAALEHLEADIDADKVTGPQLGIVAGILADKSLALEKLRQGGGSESGKAMALVDKVERQLLDGTRETHTRALIAKEGEMP